MPKIPLEDLKKDMQIKAFLMNHPFTFKTTWGLFCPEEIDVGTKLLLKAIEEHDNITANLTNLSPNSSEIIDKNNQIKDDLKSTSAEESKTLSKMNILDIGCGYGPIGISLAKAFPSASVDLIDKDFVAIDYSKKNSLENKTHNTTTFLSNGFSHVPVDKKYSLIVSNLPAKVSKEFFWILFGETFDHLETGGYFVVVVIKQLEIMARKNFNTLFGNSEVIDRDKTYSIVVAKKEN